MNKFSYHTLMDLIHDLGKQLDMNRKIRELDKLPYREQEGQLSAMTKRNGEAVIDALKKQEMH